MDSYSIIITPDAEADLVEIRSTSLTSTEKAALKKSMEKRIPDETRMSFTWDS